MPEPVTDADLKALHARLLRRMWEIAELGNSGDAEVMHGQADDMLCELLSALGYDDIVAAFKEVDKWYA